MIGMREVHLKVLPGEIYYISWNLDACEGLGLLRSAGEGRITIFTTERQLPLLLQFIDGHRAEGCDIKIEKIRECI